MRRANRNPHPDPRFLVHRSNVLSYFYPQVYFFSNPDFSSEMNEGLHVNGITLSGTWDAANLQKDLPNGFHGKD